MLTISTTQNPTTHTVDCCDAQLASEILEAALRHDLYAEADEEDGRRIFIFFIGEEILDSVVCEGREAYDKMPIVKLAA